MTPDFSISPKYRVSAWIALQLDADNETDWGKAIKIVEDRITGRFVRWIDSIEGTRFSGFAVVALDCLLIETLVGFMTGKPSSGPDLLLKGELGSRELRFTSDQAEQFRKCVRNGIIHDAETRNRWIIRPGDSTGQILSVENGSVSLNRSAFHSALKRELHIWLKKLRSGDKELRENMKRRMEQIVSLHGESVE